MAGGEVLRAGDTGTGKEEGILSVLTGGLRGRGFGGEGCVVGGAGCVVEGAASCLFSGGDGGLGVAFGLRFAMGGTFAAAVST